MAYDYHGQWDKKTGHVAPMYSHPDDFDMTYNAVIIQSYKFHLGHYIKKKKKLLNKITHLCKKIKLAKYALNITKGQKHMIKNQLKFN